MDWLDLLAVQGTLKSLLQHHSSKASVLQRSAFFMVQLSHPYMITGKTIALTSWTFVSKIMSLFFNRLSRFVIAFLPRSKRLLILWLQLLSAVILEPKKIKFLTVYIVSPSIWHEVMGPDAMILLFRMLSSHYPHFLWVGGCGLLTSCWKGHGSWPSPFSTAPCSVWWSGHWLRERVASGGAPFSSEFSHPCCHTGVVSGIVLPHFLSLVWCHLHIWGYWYFSQQSWFQLVLHPAQHFSWCTLHIS